jgi:hypothetical protein
MAHKKNKPFSRKNIPNKITSNNLAVKLLLRWLLPINSIFSKLRFHGNTKWTAFGLIFLTLFWAWSSCRDVTKAFTEARYLYKTLFGTDATIQAINTYQGLMMALVTHSSTFISLLQSIVHSRAAQLQSPYQTVGNWFTLAIDGSRETVPGTKSNEAAFCAENYGQSATAKSRRKRKARQKELLKERTRKEKKQVTPKNRKKSKKNQDSKPTALPVSPKSEAAPQGPQVWITMIWHMGLRLIWTWKLGPSNSCERTHAKELIKKGKFRKNTLFVADAGYVGYPLWKSIMVNDYHFMVRVGANVHLLWELTEYDITKKGKREYEVLCWPKGAQGKGEMPLRLRMIRIRLNKKTYAWMLTNVLDKEALTPQMAVKLYKMRWGIEMAFRGLKQTLDMGKLRCGNSKRVLVELDWAIMAMAIIELFALKEQHSKEAKKKNRGKVIDPRRRSLAETVQALRWILRTLHEEPEEGEDLVSKLQRAVTDEYERKSSKKPRKRTKNKDKKPLGDPNIRKLNEEERKKLSKILEKHHA